MSSDVPVDVSALAINVTIPEEPHPLPAAYRLHCRAVGTRASRPDRYGR